LPYTRQLPSGLWASTVRFGPGPKDRITKTHRLKGWVDRWAADLEADVRRGSFIDPRKAEVTVGAWRERSLNARRKEKASKARDDSHWRCHVAPRWERVKLSSILKTDVSGWVVEMEKAGVGAATIEGSVGVLRGLLDLAIEAEILRPGNPAAKVKKPKRDAHVDRVLDADEEQRLYDALERMFPDRVDAGLFVEILGDTGMRWEEAACVPPELVDTRKQRINIAWVMERDGTARAYAKSDAGNRAVTYGDHLAARVAAAKLAAQTVDGVFPPKGPTRLMFTAESGGPLRYSNWHRRVWTPALRGLPERVRVRGHAHRAAVPGAELDDPQPTPHDLRHKVGTQLADEGVPIHDIMALMGHEDIRSAQRYLHAREERFDRARQALKRARGGS
jgi:site-specific recombinase XerD